MSKRDKSRNIIVRAFLTLVKITIVAMIVAIGLSVYVVKSTEGQIAAVYGSPEDTVTDSELERLKSLDADCIMVLGASVMADGTPSPILKDRLDVAVDLYKKGAAPKILLSGDNGQVVYNEVQTMKNYVVGEGVPEEDVFMDHAGFSTYESVYRTKYIFKAESAIVVTQTYHLYRALYGCKRMGIEALGAASDQRSYEGQEKREVREVLARDKDLIKWAFKPQPTFLGDAVPIRENTADNGEQDI